jgi:DNA-directed RNA polymerase subunit F
MASANDEIRSSQQFANAAETFVHTLASLFPGQSFDEFYHQDTLRRAYWTALETALDCYTTPDKAPLAQGLMSGQVMAEPFVVEELLKLFLPEQTPDYAAVADHWTVALDLPPSDHAALTAEAEMLFNCLANELRAAGDLRLALEQLAQERHRLDADAPKADLDRLLDAAVVAGPGTLARQVQHLLALAAQQDDAPPADAVAALVHLAAHLSPDELRWLYAQVEQYDDPAQRARLAGQLAPYLSRLDDMPDALALVQAVLDDTVAPAQQVSVLLDVLPHLADSGEDRALPSLQQRVLAAAQAIGDPASRVRALGALVEKLPPQFQHDAVTRAFETADRFITNEVARATALSVLPSDLPAVFHARLLAIAEGLHSPDARALLLGRMIPYLSATHRLRALNGALNAIEQISGDDARTRALIALAPHIDAVGSLQDLPEGLQQVIQVTFSIERQADRARAFAALAPYLSPELLSEALQIVKDIADDHDRAQTLAKLAPHLPDDLTVAAYGVARELQTPEARATALAVIAPYLSAAARAQALADTLAAALGIADRYERVVALIDLAPHLPDDLRSRALHEALTASRSIPDEDERGRALVFLAPHLTEEHLPDALADAYTIRDPLLCVPVLCALMPFLPPEPRERVGQDVLDRARAAASPQDRAGMLAAAAPVLPEALLDEAVMLALSIEPPYDQMHVLTALLPRQPEALLDPALAAANAVPDRYQRVNALLELVPHTTPALRYPILEDALDTAQGVEDDYDRASALAHIAPYLDAHGVAQNRQQDALRLALEACFAADDPALLARVATRWAQALSPAQSYPLWREAVAFLRMQPYGAALARLAALAPVIAHIGGPGAINALRDDLLAAVE